MKRCNACDQEFEDKYSFCPVDATPLNKLAAEVSGQTSRNDPRLFVSQKMLGKEVVPRATQPEFHLTMIDNASLLQRLVKELRYISYQLRLAWPAVKRDPIGFGKNLLLVSGSRWQRALAAPDSLAAFATAMLLVFSAVLFVILVGNTSKEIDPGPGQDSELGQIVEFLPNSNVPPEGRGVGAGSRGRVGIARGRGEGSGPQPRKSGGGGAGGQHDPLPVQQGRVPPPSPIPAPIPKFPPARKLTLPAAGIDIDPVLWQNLPMARYGDPRSKSSAPSNGPGDGGGMGTANGSGIGEGSGPGFGPGKDGNIGGDRKGLGCCGSGGSQGNNVNDPDLVYPVQQVTERARVISKPEPQYTEDARRNQITGSVVLRAVFSRAGEVTNIRAIQALPFGLTERAIAAARLIRFRPATKDGRPVNVYMQLEYNFNLY